MADDVFWQKRILWSNALCGMVIPSLILTITMTLLIGIIRKTDIKHQRIMARVRTFAGDAIQTTIQANN
jgi:hypothetical protein